MFGNFQNTKIASLQHDYWPISNDTSMNHINWVAYDVFLKYYIFTWKQIKQNKKILLLISVADLSCWFQLLLI